MKFLKSEYDDLIQACSELDIPLENLSFKKKGGNLRIECLNKIIFFHRKKETVLTPNGEWQTFNRYFIRKEKDNWIEYEKWTDALSAIKDILSLK